MKMFIFEYLEQVSDRYHSGGGLIVVAKNKKHVNELISRDDKIEITEKEWEDVLVYDLENDEEPRVLVFPDAGCC